MTGVVLFNMGGPERLEDIQPFLVADAVADFTAEDHLIALDYAARR